MNHESFDDSDLTPTAVPRRSLLRALGVTAVGVMTLVGLAGCGGEDEEGEEDEEEDD